MSMSASLSLSFSPFRAVTIFNSTFSEIGVFTSVSSSLIRAPIAQAARPSEISKATSCGVVVPSKERVEPSGSVIVGIEFVGNFIY